jgi:hypothetical protein
MKKTLKNGLYCLAYFFMLHVSFGQSATKSLSVGTAFGSIAPPTDGLIVNGSVGIGIAAPTQKLDINGGSMVLGSSIASPILNIRSNANTNGSGGIIEFNESDANFGFAIRHNTEPGAYGSDGIWFENKRSGVYTPVFGFTFENRFGIGTTVPQSVFNIVNDNGGIGAQDDVIIESYAATGGQPGIAQFTSRGTKAVPANLANGDQLGSYAMGGYWNSVINNFNNNSVIRAFYRGNGTTSLTDMQFFTSGAERLRINENGNVGIGTSAPTSRLSVVSDAAGVIHEDDISISSFNTSPGATFIFNSATGTQAAPANLVTGNQLGSVSFRGQSGGSMKISSSMISNYRGDGTTNLSDLTFKTSNVDRMVIDQLGNVGIGLLNPTKPLEVLAVNIAADFRSTANQVVAQFISVNPTNRSTIGFGNTGSVNNFSVRLGAENNDMILYTDNTERIRILQAGNVGIGTSTPATLLHVEGVSPIIRVGNSTGTSGSIEFGNANHGIKRNYNNIVNDVGLYTSNSDLHFSTDNDGTTQMILKDNGFVGIGTASPSLTLDINGRTRVRNLPAGGLISDDVVTAEADGSLRRQSINAIATANILAADFNVGDIGVSNGTPVPVSSATSGFTVVGNRVASGGRTSFQVVFPAGWISTLRYSAVLTYYVDGTTDPAAVETTISTLRQPTYYEATTAGFKILLSESSAATQDVNLSIIVTKY